MPTPKRKESERRRCEAACNNCKRRKERCDSFRPCRQCTVRNVEAECISTPLPLSPNSQLDRRNGITPRREPSPASTPFAPIHVDGQYDLTVSLDPVGDQFDGPRSTSNALHPAPYRPLHGLFDVSFDGRKDFPFIGNPTGLSMLPHFCLLAETSLGPASVQDKLLQQQVHEPKGQSVFSPDSIRADATLEKPTLAEAIDSVHWCLRATNSILLTTTEPDLLGGMVHWLQSTSDGPSGSDALYYLVLAIGAQCCNEEWDEKAEKYFDYAQTLMSMFCDGDPCPLTIQCHILATIYMAWDSRPNDAFKVFIKVIRASYDLGIHQRDADFADTEESRCRERLWAAVRKLDVSISLLLGRPLATTECRDTTADEGYSPSNDMCSIIEVTVAEVYTKRHITADVLQHVMDRHREWTLRLDYHLPVAFDTQTPNEPNITTLNLKESYYLNIMLLARPFLLQAAFAQVAHRQQVERSSTVQVVAPAATSAQDCVLAHACVDSAIRALEMLKSLLTTTYLPKRLPFTTNTVFTSVMTLSVAHFADLDQAFPLNKSFAVAIEILGRFKPYDKMAARYFAIATQLHHACGLYLEGRVRREMERHNLSVMSFLGLIHKTEGPAIRSTLRVGESRDATLASSTDGIQSSCQAYESSILDMQSAWGSQNSEDEWLDQVGKSLLPDLSPPSIWL